MDEKLKVKFWVICGDFFSSVELDFECFNMVLVPCFESTLTYIDFSSENLFS
jgi:hypothetical protein